MNQKHENNRLIKNHLHRILFLLLFLPISCSETDPRSDNHMVEGFVTSISASNLVEINWFEIETNSREIIRFNVVGTLGVFTPSHLRHHMVLGEPITVSYEEKNGLLKALSVADNESKKILNDESH